MGIKFLSVLKCTLLSVVLTLLLIFGISLLSYFSAISEPTLTIAVYISTVLSVFVGAFIAARLADSKPLIASLLVSFIYYIILFLITLILNKHINPNSHFITMTVGIFASGILGAVIGK